MDGVNVDAVHAAVTACAGVATLGSGTTSGLTTYLPGRRVAGIRVNADSVDLEVVAAWGPSAADIYRQIKAAVLPFAAGRRIDVTLADIELPEQTKPAVAATSDPPQAAPAQPALPVGANQFPAFPPSGK